MECPPVMKFPLLIVALLLNAAAWADQAIDQRCEIELEPIFPFLPVDLRRCLINLSWSTKLI